MAPYCTRKWAIEGLTGALADELLPGLVATPLKPGIIHNEMVESGFGEAAADYPDAAAWAKKAVPFFLGLGPKDNGVPLSVPGVPLE